MTRSLLLFAAAVLLSAPAQAEDWRPLFNGRDLDGWVVKINHRPLGENWRDTFRVRDGSIVVAYDQYDRFSDQFGHLIYKTPFSSYRLRLEYRIAGPQTPGAPSWAVRNSGVMLHGQDPQTMALDQTFPISIEAQFLAGVSGETRPSGNVCTPGTVVSVAGTEMREHCRNSRAKTHPEGQWVKFEVEVHGSRMVRHIVDGETVFEYGELRTAPAEYAGLFAKPELAAAPSVALNRGWISLQSEGHPVEFRRIEIMELGN